MSADTDKYGVDGIPAIFLLDPNGKIVATDLRGDKIKTVVQSALNGTNYFSDTLRIIEN